MIYADQRWIGDHGIGRFARHVRAGLKYHPIPLEVIPLPQWIRGAWRVHCAS